MNTRYTNQQRKPRGRKIIKVLLEEKKTKASLLFAHKAIKGCNGCISQTSCTRICHDVQRPRCSEERPECAEYTHRAYRASSSEEKKTARTASACARVEADWSEASAHKYGASLFRQASLRSVTRKIPLFSRQLDDTLHSVLYTVNREKSEFKRS